MHATLNFPTNTLVTLPTNRKYKSVPISRILVEICQKFLLADFEVMVLIHLIEQVLNLLILHAFQDALELLLRDLPGAVLIEVIKGLLEGLELEELSSVAHAGDEFIEVYLS